MTTVEKPIKIAFVLHVMQVAGAEVLVAETIRRLGAQLDPVIICLDDIGVLGVQFQQEGVPVLNLGRQAGLDLSVASKMSRELKSRGIEIIHAHQYTPFFYAALAKFGYGSRYHLIFTEHGRHFPDVVSKKRKLINKYFFSHLADEIHGVCGFSTKALAEKDGFPASRMEVIENGIDLKRYSLTVGRLELKKRLNLDTQRRYILCVARFHPVKDHKTLLKAFSNVAAKLPDVDLLLAGDGPLRHEIEQQCVDLGLEQRVIFLGIRSDIPDLMNVSDVFTLTSLSEAASLTLMEAMASKLAVVVTDVGGNPEIIRDGIDGLLAPREDSDKLAENYIQLLSDTDKRMQFAQSAYERALERYSLDKTINEYMRRYTQAAYNLRKRRCAKKQLIKRNYES